ncbi:MAG: WecB/TagA/CpsF family glycosyltransferase [Burkholderiales bacterium]
MKSVSPFDRDVVAVLGLPFDVLNMAQAVSRVRQAAFRGQSCFISTPNLNFVMTARQDHLFRDSVLRSDLSLVDGMPVVWICKLLGLPIRERISGPNFFDELARHPSPPLKVNFLGGAAGMAQRAHERLNKSSSAGIISVGYVDPGRCSLDALNTPQVLETINQSHPDFLIVSVGAQKGQRWIELNRERLHAPIVGYFGAVVNFVAGSIKRAPLAWQQSGLEWLWRIKQEPFLWRRYWRDGWQFLSLLATCVLPLALSLRQADAGQEQPGSLICKRGPQGVRLILTGAWRGEGLSLLRHWFKALQVSETKQAIVVDLSCTSHVDSRCIGLLMLARGVFGSRFQVEGARPPMYACFRRHLAGYLFEQPHSSAG